MSLSQALNEKEVMDELPKRYGDGFLAFIDLQGLIFSYINDVESNSNYQGKILAQKIVQILPVLGKTFIVPL